MTLSELGSPLVSAMVHSIAFVVVAVGVVDMVVVVVVVVEK